MARAPPTVLQPAYSGEFYAHRVLMDPNGGAVWLLDAQFREFGGGVHRIPIGCDGRLGPATRIAPGRLAYGMEFADSGRAIVASKDLLSVPLGADVHIVDLAAPSVIGSGDAFAHDDWIGAGFALAGGGAHAIVGDNSGFSSEPNAISVVALTADTVTRLQTIPVTDPVSIVASPFDDAVLVVSGFPEALTLFPYDSNALMPLGTGAAVPTAGLGLALPYGTVTLDRGSLNGRVLVAENLAIRQLQFASGGLITDLGTFDLGESVGSIGMQP